MRRYTLEGSSLQFVADMVAAQPPRSAQAASSVPADFGSVVRRVSYGVGSNAVALGKDATTDGRGLLLGNPHYPWQGILRFYQFHLTIPGKLDVMGAALPGLPRSEEHTSELQSLMRISYAVFCLKKKNKLHQ